MPVMEGKCVLFKEFGGIDAFPICIDSKDPDEIVRTVQLIAKSFGGINLEDISAPRCFEIERRLQEVCDIPVFHDDQHGTAIVLCAAADQCAQGGWQAGGQRANCHQWRGAAGISIAKLILQMKLGSVVLVDRFGIIWDGNPTTIPRRPRWRRSPTRMD